MTEGTGKTTLWPDDPASRLVTARELAAGAGARAEAVSSLQSRGSVHRAAIARENARIAEDIDSKVKATHDESHALQRKPFWIFQKAAGRLKLLIVVTWIAGLLRLLARIAAVLALFYVVLVYVVPAILRLLWSILLAVLGF